MNIEDYQLVNEKHPILRTPTNQVDLDNPPFDLSLFSNIMKDLLIKYKGLGLSANQIGVPYSIFVFGNPEQKNDLITMINPRIVSTFGKSVYMMEGCLSFPSLMIKIKRPEGIRVRYVNEFNQTMTTKFEGMSARVIQHETDHLNGITFLERASLFHKDQALRKRKTIRRLSK